MRITIIQGAFFPVPPLRGGAVEKMWFRLGQEFVAAGESLTQISRRCDGLAARETIEGVEHWRLPGFDTPRSLLLLKWLDLRYTFRVYRLLRTLPRPDILIMNTFWAPILLRGKQSRAVTVVDFARMPKGQVRYYAHVSCLRVNSEAVRKAVVREYPEIADKVRLIPNPLPFSPPREIPWHRKERVLLYAGRVHPEKGLHLLAPAWRELSGQFPGWRLEIAGPWDVERGGGGESYRRKLIRLFGNSPVQWHGLLGDADQLQKLYESSSLFLYPSVAEQGETFGLAPLEAMAYGSVPILSSLDCFAEFALAGENCWIFNHRGSGAEDRLCTTLEEAMQAMANPAPHPRALAAAATAHAFDPSRVATSFLKLFQSLRQKTESGM